MFGFLFGKISLALVIHPFLLLLGICLCLGWCRWVWSYSLDLRVANSSCALAFPCFFLLWFGLHIHFFALSHYVLKGWQ
jgi:hypothetical protein